MYIVTVQRCGDDYIIPLPQQIVDELGLKDGDQLEVQVEGKGVILLRIG